MLLGVNIPLVTYTICAVLLAIDNGTKKELPQFISENHAYLAATGFLCQMLSVFSFGIKLTVRNFALCVLIAAMIGILLYEIFWSVRQAEMKKHPSFQAVLDHCRSNPAVSVTVTYGCIQVLPDGKTFASPAFDDRVVIQGRQISESMEMKRFSRLLARKLGFGIRHKVQKKDDWELDGSYTLYGNGSISPNGHRKTWIEWESYYLFDRKVKE